jgi:hypothetical protein
MCNSIAGIQRFPSPERVKRFVARIPVGLATDSAGCPRSFSALGDQRAEILPVR